MSEIDEHAPRVIIFVEGEKVEDQILEDIISVDYENSLYLTDEMTLNLANHEGRYTDAVMWGHGNEVELWYGYGQDMYFIGRTELIRHMPSFPSDGIMSFKMKGRDRSWRMKKQPTRISGGRTPKRRNEIGSQWEGPLAAYLRKLAKKYGFKTDISKKFEKINEKFAQKRGQTDFQVFQALANFHYATARIEYRIEVSPREGAWYLVFKDLDEVTQEKQFPFRYHDGEDSTILDVSFEFGLSETLTEVKAYYWDPSFREEDVYKEIKKNYPEELPGGEVGYSTDKKLVRRGRRVGAWREVSATDYKKEYKDVPVEAKRDYPEILPSGEVGYSTYVERTKKVLKKDHDPFHKRYRSQRAQIDEEPTPTRLRLVVGGHSVEVLTRPFKNAEDARNFVLSWLKQNQNNFITAKGTLPGTAIKAGETHILEGPTLGKRFSGLYYFTNVTQKYGETGWITDFQARKVLTQKWLKEQRATTKGLAGQPET